MPDDEPVLQVDELGLFDIGQRLIELGEQLKKVGTYTEDPNLREALRTAEEVAVDEVWDSVERRVQEGLRRTLVGLRDFRRSYDYWERVIAEYMLSKRGFTQRDAARLLGVSAATINRWAQHPVEVPILRDEDREPDPAP
jgi:hypothetical protein